MKFFLRINLCLFCFFATLISDAHYISTGEFVDDKPAELLRNEVGHFEVVYAHIESDFERAVRIFRDFF